MSCHVPTWLSCPSPSFPVEPSDEPNAAAMEASAQQEKEFSVSELMGIPAVPHNRRDCHPSSGGTALHYRLKLAFALLVAATAAFDRPELRLPLLLNCWLLCLTCEAAHPDHPWREPLNDWMWRLRWAVPYSEVLFCSALLLVWHQSGAGCEPLPHPLVSASVFWLCCMLSWPLVRGRWHRRERKDVDYDQYSADRPRVLTFSRPLELVLTTLQSPSLLVPLAMGVSAYVAAPLHPRWAADAWAACAVVLVLGCLALLCCRTLPLSIERTRDQWKAQEAAHAHKIGHALSAARNHLYNPHMPLEDSALFHRLSVQVPLLQREARILLKAGRTLDDVTVRELQRLTASEQVTRFEERLDRFGPYTTQCCVS